MAGISGIYGQLGSFGETMGAAMQSARGFKRRLLQGVGGVAKGPPSLSPMGGPPRGMISTAVKGLKAAVSGRKGTLLHGIQMGGKQIGLSGAQLGQARNIAGRVAKPAGLLAGGYAIGKARGRRQEKKYMMRGLPH